MENKVKPISPKEAAELHVFEIPDCVFEAVNKLLVKRYTGNGQVRIGQN